MVQHQAIWVAGCMSGTSMDGVDVALLKTDGTDIFEIGQSAYAAFADDDRKWIAAALGQWPDGPDVSKAARIVEDRHIALLRTLPKPDLIGFHGQTLAHDPANRRTHQAGDGARLAAALDAPVIWDFRSDDVAMGGQGAPLAPAYHYALVRWAGVHEPVMILNLGGVGNATLVDPSKPLERGGVLAFDTGPANAPLNDIMQARCAQPYDKDAVRTRAGRPDQTIVVQAMAHPYFDLPVPKSLDRNDFAGLLDLVAELTVEDALATVTQVIAQSVADSLKHLPTSPVRVLVTGGGRKNPAIMQALCAQIDLPVDQIEDIGADGDMVEAQAFAYLAARVKNGFATSFPLTTGVAMPMAGGTLSRPD